MQFRHVLPYFRLLPEIEAYQITALCEQTQLKEIKAKWQSLTQAQVYFHSTCTSPVPAVTTRMKTDPDAINLTG